MQRDDPPYLLYIEPIGPASPTPVIDDLTMKMTAALQHGAPGIMWGARKEFVEGSYHGFHEWSCGAMSEAHDYKITGGFVTNSLCVHYLAHHRDEVPPSELEKVATLDCGTAMPSPLNLAGMWEETEET